MYFIMHLLTQTHMKIQSLGRPEGIIHRIPAVCLRY